MEPTKDGVSRYIPQIDALRALAFLLVCLDHFAISDWAVAIHARGLPFELFEAVIHNGWFGVPLFLFLSGFSLALGKTSPNLGFDLKQFYLNRMLRIYPMYLVCVTLLAFTHHLSGRDVLSIVLMQTQDIPKQSAFAVLWSIQLEMGCYLLYPIFLRMIRTNDAKTITSLFLALLAFRLTFLPYAPESQIWHLWYSTVFGGASIFFAGILAASIRPVGYKTARYFLLLGVILFLGFSWVIFKLGGYTAGTGKLIRLIWLFSPEAFALICFVLVVGAISQAGSPPPTQHRSRKPFPSLRSSIFQAVCHVGRVSYSGYVLHMLVMYSFIVGLGQYFDKSSLLSFLLFFAAYFGTVVVFAHLTFHSIELPFLKYRKSYVGSGS